VNDNNSIITKENTAKSLGDSINSFLMNINKYNKKKDIAFEQLKKHTPNVIAKELIIQLKKK
jgi:hypothetical protein